MTLVIDEHGHNNEVCPEYLPKKTEVALTVHLTVRDILPVAYY